MKLLAEKQRKRADAGWRKVILMLSVILGVTASIKGYAMGNMVLFSAVRGTVLQNGTPVIGASIDRTFKWDWKDEEGHDGTVTDNKGQFSLSEITRSSLFGSLLPHEPVIKQAITITYAGKTHKAWVMFKRDYEKNGELDGRPIVMTCRLEAEPRRQGEIFGMCDLD